MKKRYIFLLLLLLATACKRPPCPTYMTPEEVKELKPTRKNLDKKGRIKKKSPSSRIR